MEYGGVASHPASADQTTGQRSPGRAPPVIMECATGAVDAATMMHGVTPAWFTAALAQRHPGAQVTAATIRKIVVGCSAKLWVDLAYTDPGNPGALPSTMVLKAGFERQMAFTYQCEAAAYRDVLPRYPINAPRCFYAGPSPDGRSCAVLLEDLSARGARFCHALRPLEYDQAAAFLDALARTHAASWQAPCLTDGSWDWVAENQRLLGGLGEYWVHLTTPSVWDGFVALPRGAAIPRKLHDRPRLMQGLDNLRRMSALEPQVVLVGDCHLGNLYFDADGTPGFLDFQSRISCWAEEVAYFMGAALDILDRRAWEKPLLTHYLARLANYGVAAPAFASAWDSYARNLLFAFLVWLTNGQQFQTEEVNTANTARLAAAVLETGSFERLGLA